MLIKQHRQTDTITTA